MTFSIKKYVKNTCLDNKYSLDSFNELVKEIHAKSKKEHNNKKITKLLCYYAKVINNEIIFDIKNKDKENTFENLSKACETIKQTSRIRMDYLFSDTTPKDTQQPKVKKTSGIRMDYLVAEDCPQEKKQVNTKSSGDFKYPQVLIPNIKNTNKFHGPYGTQWVHDMQHDDKLTPQEKKRQDIFKHLDSIEYPEQRSDEWFVQRREKITASDGGCVVGMNKYEPQWKFVQKKVIEMPFQNNVFCYHGKKLEEIATMVYEYRMNVKVKEFGMICHPKIQMLGASPDGIVSPYKLDGKHLTKYVGRMLEIKCPFTRKIKIRGPIKGEQCPIYYWVQVQQQLECCDLDECDFWQCSIGEYKSRDEFIEDTNPKQPFLSKTTKMEKGTLFQLLPFKLPEEANNMTLEEKRWAYTAFIYPPKIEMSPYDVDIWISETISNLGETHPDHYLDKVIYWKMKFTSNVTVMRDTKWFDEYLPQYEKVWKYVTFLRENKDKADILFNYLNKIEEGDKTNDDIMELYEKIYNVPKENCKKEQSKYAKFIKTLL